MCSLSPLSLYKNLNEHKSYDQVLQNLSIKVKDIKTHKSPGLCFKLFILSRKCKTKLKLVLAQTLFVQLYTHFGTAVKKVKTERVVQDDSQLCARVWGSRVYMPSLDCFQKHSYIHSGHFKLIGS